MNNKKTIIFYNWIVFNIWRITFFLFQNLEGQKWLKGVTGKGKISNKKNSSITENKPM